MRRLAIVLGVVALMLCGVGQVIAAIGGLISTDRFGYGGTAIYYTQSDYENGMTNGVAIDIVDRDLSLYIGNNCLESANIIMGSWWYTTDPSGSAGWGNTRGNTGVGFLQLYDTDSITDTSLSTSFGGWDGSHYTEFVLSLIGNNATYENTYARFSPFTSNTNDSGTFLSYNLALTATGLEGVETAPGMIEAFNHPTGVVGNFSGVFLNTSSDMSKAGYYVFDLDLNMTNWAYENRDALTGDAFADSYFATQDCSVPEPTTLLIWSILGVLGAVAYGRQK